MFNTTSAGVKGAPKFLVTLTSNLMQSPWRPSDRVEEIDKCKQLSMDLLVVRDLILCVLRYEHTFA